MLRLVVVLTAAVLLTAQSPIPLPVPRPSHEAPQAPQVNPQQQSENNVSGQSFPDSLTITRKDSASEKQHEDGGGGATEVSILGVKISLGELLLGLGTFGLWFATQRLVSEAKATSQRQLRAYLLPEIATITDYASVQPSPPPVFTGRVAGLVQIKNSGQTPAYDVLHWGEVVVMPIALESTLTLPAEMLNNGSNTVGPGSFAQKTGWASGPLTAIEIAEIRAGTTAVYVHGKITYRDAFKRKRESTYRLFYCGNWPPAQGATLSFCAAGNSSN